LTGPCPCLMKNAYTWGDPAVCADKKTGVHVKVRVILFCALIISLLCAAVHAETHSRVMVLGFRSAQFNDVQDRIFREMLLRATQERKYGIIPVMEIESLCLKVGAGRIRGVPCAELARYCAMCSADACVSGSLERVSGQGGHAVRKGQKYRCKAVIFMNRTGKCVRISRTVKCRGDLHDLFADLSEALSKGIDSVLRKDR